MLRHYLKMMFNYNYSKFLHPITHATKHITTNTFVNEEGITQEKNLGLIFET
jgi:hypothetical protein